ncbi:hypothetical protein ACP3TJ_03780 [Desulforudis sp. 1088]|jgi:hypothetical protein|uniref:hypothetical protein n=1 Tax=unclassified Candidatus Desulforudis TaxID=2635950 RepID=UPI003470243F
MGTKWINLLGVNLMNREDEEGIADVALVREYVKEAQKFIWQMGETLAQISLEEHISPETLARLRHLNRAAGTALRVASLGIDPHH